MVKYRNYWTYSAALAVVWIILLIAVTTIKGFDEAKPFFYVFAGFFIGWVSTTIARYIYPPPKVWDRDRRF